jgi:DNA repair protein RecO (recombination protein O)
VELIAEPAVLTGVAAGNRERLLTFVTRGHGGVRLFARRQTPRAAATVFLEPLQGGELVFLLSREGGRMRLHSFVPQRVWPGIRADLNRTVHALAFLELLNGTLAEGEPHTDTFELLVRFLNRLEEESRPGLARIAASLRLLAGGGFTPCLDGCTVCRCGVDAGGGAVFSPEAGGIVCRNCRIRQRLSALPISPGALGLLQRALSLPEGRMRRLRVTEAVEREASRLLDAFVEARTGVRPRWGSAIERLEAG